MAQRKAAPPVGVPTADPYVRNALVISVVDGDTAHFTVELGCDIRLDMTVRFYGINAPEHGTPEGDASTAWLKRKLKPKQWVVLRTHKDQTEKFGRYLAEIFRLGDPISVNQQSVNAGHAVPYFGHGPK